LSTIAERVQTRSACRNYERFELLIHFASLGLRR
jgi:hypothetical protein